MVGWKCAIMAFALALAARPANAQEPQVPIHHFGSISRGVHVYCGSDNPEVYCKAPSANTATKSKLSKKKD
jgi:hypothetical protein